MECPFWERPLTSAPVMESIDTPFLPPGLQVQALTAKGVDQAQRLVVEAGWNQTPQDWFTFLKLGQAYQVTTSEGEIVATAATLPYPPHSGWISMVLVSQKHRRQGIASALLALCIQTLRSANLAPWLDATQAGRAVYHPLGFKDGMFISRWRLSKRCPALELPHQSPRVRPLLPSDWSRISGLDHEAFGADRTALLKQLHARSTSFSCVAEQNGKILGFLLGRLGRTATQIGPLVALDEPTALALMAFALPLVSERVLIDAIDLQVGLSAQLQSLGFEFERGFTRMALDASPNAGDSALVFAISGPELG